MKKLIQKILDPVILRVRLLKLFIKNTLQTELAYVSEGWGNLFSVFFYTFSAIIGINIMFANTSEIGGYNKDEMTFLFLIGQMCFYIFGIISIKNIPSLVNDIKLGNLDKVFTLPAPAMFYTTFRKFSILALFRDVIPALFFILVVINWDNIQLSAFWAIGIIIFILGYISFSAISHSFTYLAFWVGEASSLAEIPWIFQFDLGYTMPFEAWRAENIVKLIMIFTPFFLTVAVTASVMLGKMSYELPLFLSIISFLFFTTLQKIIWKKGLRAYSSASS